MEPSAFVLVFWITAASPIVVPNMATRDECRELGEKMGADVKLSSFNCYGYRQTGTGALERPAGYRPEHRRKIN